jgi:peptide/nickel transport system permease protein
MAEAMQVAPAPHSQPTTWAGRFFDSDVWASFKRSKLTMAAAFLTFVFMAAAVLAGVVSPQDPFDPAQLDLMNSRLPPIWDAEGLMPFILGTDEQGRDIFSAILYGLRSAFWVSHSPRRWGSPWALLPVTSVERWMPSSCVSPTCN